MGRRRSIHMLAFTLGLTLAACASQAPNGPAGGDSSTSTSSTRAAFPVTVHGTNGDVDIAARPERIVSLSPTATEDLFAIGAGDQVVAVDEESNYPSDTPRTKLSGLEPNIEAIAGYEPDLVVYSYETGDISSSLEKLRIPALQLDAAASLGDVYDQIQQLGQATGNADQADALVATMKDEVQQIVSGVDPSPGLSFYYELDDTYYSVTSRTFVGRLFKMFGLENIADAAGKGSGGYPQLSAEYILKADPDLIFLADTKCCGQSPQTVTERPGWDRIGAVRDGGVIPLDDDVASRWGPRVVDLLRGIADAVTAAETKAA